MKSKAEPEISKYHVGDRFQFLRKGYFIIDQDTTEDHMVCNRIVGLRDTWSKVKISSNYRGMQFYEMS